MRFGTRLGVLTMGSTILLNAALTQALVRERPLLAKTRRSATMIAVDPDRASDNVFQTLRAATSRIVGTLPDSTVRWTEAARIKLTYKLERLWLLLEPTIWIEHIDGVDIDRELVRDFIQRRLTGRYNAVWNRLIAAWADVIVGDVDAQECTLYSFGIGDGVDAAFNVSKITAFSRRGYTR